MNRSEALAFFDAAYKRGMQWIDAMESELERAVEVRNADFRSRRPYRFFISDLSAMNRRIESARDTHRETMAMIAWEVCGPAFVGEV
jgi:hypothetical protein